MKKMLILILLMFSLTACIKKEVHVYQDEDIAEFDNILKNIGNGKTKAYDLRLEETCIEGRIPGFFCMRTTNSEGVVKSLDSLHDNLVLLIGKKYGYLIILIDDDGTDSSYLANKLFASGYYNVHYFASGYETYKELKGPTFVPQTGECNIC